MWFHPNFTGMIVTKSSCAYHLHFTVHWFLSELWPFNVFFFIFKVCLDYFSYRPILLIEMLQDWLASTSSSCAYLRGYIFELCLTELWPLGLKSVFVVLQKYNFSTIINSHSKNTQTSIHSSYISNKLSNHPSIQPLNWLFVGNTYDHWSKLLLTGIDTNSIYIIII